MAVLYGGDVWRSARRRAVALFRAVSSQLFVLVWWRLAAAVEQRNDSRAPIQITVDPPIQNTGVCPIE